MSESTISNVISGLGRRDLLKVGAMTVGGGVVWLSLNNNREGMPDSRPAADEDSGWPMYQGDITNSGIASTTGPTESVGVRWGVAMDRQMKSSPAVVDGTVYVGGPDGYVVALSVDDGTEQWRVDTKGRVDTSPAVVNETVYVGNSAGYIYALDAAEGTEQWSFDTGYAHTGSPSVILGSATVADGTVYLGSRDRHVWALSASDGAERWRVDTGHEVWVSPAVSDGTVFVANQAGNVSALDASDGTEQWNFGADDSVISSPAVIDGTVYVGSQDGHVYALDAAEGTDQWHFDTGGDVLGSPTVVENTVYVGNAAGHVYSLDTKEGSEQWHFKIGEDVLRSPAMANNIIYMGDHGGNIYGLAASDGTKRWHMEVGSGIRSSPAVTDGTVYVSGWDGNVYALAEERDIDRDLHEHINWIIPYERGSLVDTYSRGVIEIIPDHIPGEPSITPVNRTDARGVVGANSIWSAEPDGTTIGMVEIPSMVAHQIFADTMVDDTAEDVEYELTEMSWIGRIRQDQFVVVTRATDPPFETLTELQLADAVSFPVVTPLDSIWIVTGIAGSVLEIDLNVVTDIDWFNVMEALRVGNLDCRIVSARTYERFENNLHPIVVLDSVHNRSKLKGVPLASDLSYTEFDGTFRSQVAIVGPPGMDDDLIATLETAFLETPESKLMSEQPQETPLPVDVSGSNETTTAIDEWVNLARTHRSALENHL